MKGIIVLQEHITLANPGIKALADKITAMETWLLEMDDLKPELRTLKFFFEGLS